MERIKRAVSLILCFVMVFGLLPMHAFAATADDSLTAALTEAREYIDKLTVDNASNDPETVVKNYGTYFSWDNEKRESGKSYLYDWSYYNGVVFEGIEYLYEVTGEQKYKDYVVEYMSSLITAAGGWATCSNNSGKTCAGYVNYHGADCYKTASLLLDVYEMTNDQRYLTMAESLYLDLNKADNSNVVMLDEAGNNYRHTWASNPTPDLWLDGLYMILPFRAEYAKHAGKQEELNQIVSRLQWVSDNMDNGAGLFYHAADNASSNSGTFWLRSIGWYAAAVADVMDSMEGSNLETMKEQLVKLVEGMMPYQRESGLWSNAVTGTVDSNANREETSGTALLAYAILKAVNEGWIEESYADVAIKAFKGICENKLDGTELKDICFIGTPGSSNAKFYNNEGKGVGPFIMLTAEVQEYVNKLKEEPEVPETSVPEVSEPEVTEPDTTPVITHISVEGTTAYAKGDDLTFTTLKAFYNGGSIDLMDENGYPNSDVKIDGTYDMNTVGSYSVTVTYGEFKRTYHFTVAEPETLSAAEGITISGCGTGISNVSAQKVTDAAGVVAGILGADGSVTFDLSGSFLSTGFKATVVLPVEENWENVAVYHVDGDKYTKYEDVDSDPTTYTFVTNHFSIWEQTYDLKAAAEEGDTANSVSGSGNLVGGKVYTLDTDGVSTNKNYLIVSGNSGDVSALTNNGSSTPGSTSVRVSGNTITVDDDSNIAWQFSGTSSGTVGNSGRYVVPGNGSLSLNTSGTNLTLNSNNDGSYKLWYSARSGMTTYYYTLRYNNGWTGYRQRSSAANYYVYLYEWKESTAGESVTFTVNPASVSVAPKGTVALTGTVTVGGEEVDLSNCTITWASADISKATVSNGTVTGVADGTANITATLSAVNGTALQENIVLTIPVTVASKTVVSGVLSGNTPVTTRLNVQPDFSNIKLTVTYEDGTTAVITTANGLIIDGYSVAAVGSDFATISYAGKEYGTVRVTVAGNPYEGLENATTYPEYPADGAVRIDKTAKELEFASTGLVEVELDVAGVSVKPGVDAVLTIDISNSMAWAVGTKDDNWEHNKLTDVMTSIKEFANIFLAPNEDGTPTNNTISIVTFAGKDSENWNNTDDYSDSVRTLVTCTSSLEVINAIADNSKFVGKIKVNNTTDYGLQLGYIPEGADQNDVSKVVVTEPFVNRGDTNYDYAFWQTEQTVDKIIAANTNSGETREIHVLFMTDGCASNFNGAYYRSRNVNHAYVPGTKTVYTNHEDGLTGTEWTEYIMNTLIPASKGNTYAKSLYQKINGMYAVGFDMANGSFSGIGTWDSAVKWHVVFNDILKNVVQDDEGNGMINVTDAQDTETLKKFYSSLARELRYAGTQANVTDVIDSDFTLQMSNTTGTVGKGIGQVDIAAKGYKPTITIKTYDLWTKDETDDPAKIGTRKGTSQPIETVTFNADGTKAYSDLVENGTVNIMTISNGVVYIDAHYFNYSNLDGVETFRWKIGNITDKEIALSYMAYLKGSLEGEEPDGLKYTNEEAILEYIDINGKHATQTFPVPAVAWGGASTAYEFYLVNYDGLPCDRNGNVVPFANRIIITGPYYEELYLNQEDEEKATDIIGAYVLPAGYTLYDETAKYEVQTASGDNEGYLTISAPGYGLIAAEETYTGDRFSKVENADGTVEYVADDNGAYKKITVQTTIQVYPEADSTDKSYIQSRVAFGVIYNMIPSVSTFTIAPDQVVIDYGKSIVIDVNANNTEIPSDVTATLIGFSRFYEDIDPKHQFSSTSSLPVYEGTYGTFTINADNKVVYTPHKFVNSVGKIFCHYRITSSNDTYYMVSELYVIPATIVYYETDFATGVFTTATTGDASWSTKTEGAASDGPQDDGTIGQNTYGFDASYDNDAYLSNGNSLFVEGEGYEDTTVTFSFTGTGFDLISRTGAAQGLIKVQVATDAKMTNIVKTVSVLNKSESELELYQIPVVSINGLPYGTYYVKIGVNKEYAPPSEALAALARGNEFYFDAIRIYDPAKGNAIAEAAYNADGEANNKLDEVRALLLSAETYTNINGVTTGMVFIDRTQNNTNVVADYATIGPNNEVYLSEHQAVAFQVKAGSIPASFDIGAKSITGSTAGLKVTIRNADGSKSWTVTKEINSSTVQFIDLLIATGADASLLYQGAYVVITNTGVGVLSITDIKTAFSVNAATAEVDTASVQDPSGISVASVMTTEVADPYAVSFTVDGNTLAVARSVLFPLGKPQKPETPEEPEIPEEPEVDASKYEILDASVKVNGSKKNQKFTITVVTSQEVDNILVFQNSEELTPSKISFKDKKKDGTRTWTIVLTSGVSQRFDSFTLIGVDDSGFQGEALVVSKPH